MGEWKEVLCFGVLGEECRGGWLMQGNQLGGKEDLRRIQGRFGATQNPVTQTEGPERGVEDDFRQRESEGALGLLGCSVCSVTSLAIASLQNRVEGLSKTRLASRHVLVLFTKTDTVERWPNPVTVKR